MAAVSMALSAGLFRLVFDVIVDGGFEEMVDDEDNDDAARMRIDVALDLFLSKL